MKHNPLIRGEESLIVVSLKELKATDNRWRWIVWTVGWGAFIAGLIVGVWIESHF